MSITQRERQIASVLRPLSSAPRRVRRRCEPPGFNARVRIAPCGDALCGHIVWVWDETPRGIADKSPLVGRKVIEGMLPDSTARWSGGRLYNPEDGRDYKGSLTLAGTNRLNVDGCVLFICKSQAWRRADSERCPPVATP